MEDFRQLLPDLQAWMMAQEADEAVVKACSCRGSTSRGLRIVRCQQCYQCLPTCAACWAENHRNAFTHTPQVWNKEKGFFESLNLVQFHELLQAQNQKVHCWPQFGHKGRPCPHPQKTRSPLIVMDIHGVHDLEVYFCNCGPINRAKQLVEARLFPGSAKQPGVAFSFDLLRQFQLLHVEAAVNVNSICSTWQRMTNNYSPWDVPVSLRFTQRHHSKQLGRSWINNFVEYFVSGA